MARNPSTTQFISNLVRTMVAYKLHFLKTVKHKIYQEQKTNFPHIMFDFFFKFSHTINKN